MLTFYTTEPIDHKKPWANMHHNVPQGYLKTILKEKVPQSRLILSNTNAITKILNKGSLEANVLEKVELNRFEKAKEDLESRRLKEIIYLRQNKRLMNDPSISESPTGDVYYTTRHQITQEIYKTYKNERQEFRQCLCNWVEEPLDILSELMDEEFPIKTDIDGIIVPIAHADWSDLPTIVKGIGGRFGNELKEKLLNKRELETDEKLIGEHFFKSFKIPVFNSPDFAPGHRHSLNFKEHAYNDWLIEANRLRKWEDKIKHVEFAYSLWLDRNFTDKQ